MLVTGQLMGFSGKGTKWFSGKISRVNRDGTFDIRYDDGDSETGALKTNIRPHPDSRMAAAHSEPAEFFESEAVEVLYKGIVIIARRADGSVI